MAVDTSEKNFESSIETYLVEQQGYVKRQQPSYDVYNCLDTELLFNFIYSTQAQTWEKLKQQRGDVVKEQFIKRLTEQIKKRGTLEVLRKGITDLGCQFDLAYFTPSTKLNPEHQKLYKANIFSINRQVYFSEKNRKSIDTVIFLNGIPLFTIELKNPFKGQTVENAVKQYKYDRDPKDPLLAFRRCLAHFAVDTDQIFMTTNLRGNKTYFLPFNKGNDNGAGNPENPNGFKTSYFWEEILTKDSVLDLVKNFIQEVDELDKNGQKTGKKKLIFPRYHQLQAVRNLIAHSRHNGTAQRYLIQHSAGSGKSNSIAWLAHQLYQLNNDNNERIFNSIIVLTDRKVLDKQLQDNIIQFEQTKGTVENIDKTSRELKKALEDGKDIIVSTIQKFPVIMGEMAAFSTNKFAVIVDEAHSSQGGESRKSVMKVLSDSSYDDEVEEEDATDEDIINSNIEDEQKIRGRLPNVSFFAFTATPKNKTLELFGEKQEDGSFKPFNLYSMKQAIEEGFILNVLENYTTFKQSFHLLKKIEEDPEYDKKKAMALLKAYVNMHEHPIKKKTQIIVEHFKDKVMNKIDGQAKAMLVTSSRANAVKYKKAFDRYIKEQGYPFKALVAFSGEVIDKDTYEKVTEVGMNNGLKEKKLPEEFDKPEYRFLIVANKYQTGFDQPLLHTMYVDKKLGGVNAVQTLSRLNRTTSGKEDTMVLDFTNEADDIQKSFQPYFVETNLVKETDPNRLNDIKQELDDYYIYSKKNVDDFAQVYFSEKGSQDKLHALVDPVVESYRVHEVQEEKQEFRKKLTTYVRLYAFLAQIITFSNPELEKFYQFAKFLHKKLPKDRSYLPKEVLESVNMDSWKLNQTSTGEINLIDKNGELQPLKDAGAGKIEEEMTPLSQILEYINEHFADTFTADDKVKYFYDDMQNRLEGNQHLVDASNPEINSKPQFRDAFENFFNDTLISMMDNNKEIFHRIVKDNNFGTVFKNAMFEAIYTKLVEERKRA